jgi:hypothetical protein
MSIRKKYPISLLIMLLACGNISLHGQQQVASNKEGKAIVLQFKFNEVNIEQASGYNTSELNQLKQLLGNKKQFSKNDTLEVTGTASAEGKYNYNLNLAEARARSCKKFMLKHYPALNSVTIKTVAYVNNLDALKNAINTDQETPYKAEVLDVLNTDRDPGVKCWKLKQIGEGSAWKYITDRYAEHLPAGKGLIRFKASSKTDQETPKVKHKEEDKIEIKESEIKHQYTPAASERKVVEAEVVVETETIVEAEVVVETETVIDEKVVEVVEEKSISSKKELFAIKTNLLFDLLSLVNLEVEVPIGERWSIAGEWIFPWWIVDNGAANSKRHRIQVLNANIEGKYWFGNRTNRPRMTGWFTGVYTGAGLYDFEYNAKGYQGEFLINGGITAGYAHTINKSKTLRMEYTVGVGYAQTEYRHYEAYFGADNKWTPIRQETGRYEYIGPTRAKISLVWMLNRKNR